MEKNCANCSDKEICLNFSKALTFCADKEFKEAYLRILKCRQHFFNKS